MNNPQRNADGEQVVHSANSKNRRKIGEGAATEAITQSKTASHETKNSKFEHNQSLTTMGRGDGKIEL